MRTVLRHCSTCGDEREFEAPPCPDGHGCDCPELACVRCGTALVVEFVPPALPRPAAVGTAA
jgi:hypothetical protein